MTIKPKSLIAITLGAIFIVVIALPVCSPRPGNHNPLLLLSSYYEWLWLQPGGSQKVIGVVITVTLVLIAAFSYEVFRIKDSDDRGKLL